MEISIINSIVTLLLIFLTFYFLIIRKLVKRNRNKEVIDNYIYKVQYSLITTNSELSYLVNKIKTDKIELIGLDVEYHRGLKYQGEISLFQISLPDKKTYVIDVMQIEKNEIKSSIKEIFESVKI